jgi:cyclase
MTTAQLPEHVELPPPEVVEVSDGVFAYVQLDGSWGLNNAGFLVGRDAVTVIDTCFTERRSRAFHESVRATVGGPSTASGRAEVRTLVNTHHHEAIIRMGTMCSCRRRRSSGTRSVARK